MIITNNEEALRIACDDVQSEEIGALIFTLENELNRANRLGSQGIGLAAPQIGLAKKIAIVRLGNGMDINLVNVKIDKSYDPITFTQEGCLSFPGRLEDTTRFQEVHITNNLVAPQRFIVTGLLAIAIQHEIDHLNSILFMDRKINKSSVTISNKKPGPNQLCMCGSNKKFKKCCGK